MNTATKTALIEFLTENGPSEIDFKYFLESEDFNSFDEVRDLINAGDGFNIEIIYYSKAIIYLSENDPSLRTSLNLAAELGYSPENLNSELLASLLATEQVRERFEELQAEFNALLDELTDSEDEN